MELSKLYDELLNIGVKEDEIYLHGLYGSTDDNDKLCLAVKVGKHTAIWEVYYKERGIKDSIREFDTESKACEYYLKEMKKIEKYF